MAASTPRKAPARRTAPAGARPAAKKSAAASDPAIDLLADFGTEEKPPVPIKLDGVEADVLRGYSGKQAVEFHRLVGAMEFDKMLELITTNGAALWEYVGGLTPEYASVVLNKIINLSELHEGNLLAPLPGYGMNPAGAQPSPLSTDTTG